MLLIKSIFCWSMNVMIIFSNLKRIKNTCLKGFEIGYCVILLSLSLPMLFVKFINSLNYFKKRFMMEKILGLAQEDSGSQWDYHVCMSYKSKSIKDDH